MFDTKVTPGIFFGQLFNSRDTIHLAHLQTTSFAEHKALNEYYDTLLSLTDELIEVYFGMTKRWEIKIPSANYISPQAHLKTIRMYVESNRGILGTASHIQNIVDEIMALIDKTQYLLTLS